MASNSWKNGASGDWTTGALWASGTVPVAGDDVTIDAVPNPGPTYTVTIAQGQSFDVGSLTMNLANTGAQLDINGGTLAFANISQTSTLTGNFLGSLETVVNLSNATIKNVGTINAFIQATGNNFFTGSNPIYFTDYLQSLGNVTIDTSSIGEVTGDKLFDGIFQAEGTGTSINFGGSGGGDMVNIATIEGPGTTGLFTEVIFDQPNSAITEWNGANHVSIETSLTDITSGGTVDVLQERDFNTTHALSIGAGGVFNLQAGTVTTGSGLNINAGGVVQGNATITSLVTNNSTLEALNGTLVLAGNLTGTGVVDFDQNLETGGTLSPTGATLGVHGVSTGQTINMNGDDTLQLLSPNAFAGTLSAKLGDTIVLQGVTATSAVINAGSLVVNAGTTTVADIKLSGTYTGDGFNLTTNGGNTTLVLATQTAPVVGGFPANQTGSDNTALAPFTGITVSDPDPNAALNATIVLTSGTLATDADGTLAGSGVSKTGIGTYTLAATTAATLGSELAALMFTPTNHQVAPGNSVTTNFALTVADGGAATNANASIAVTAQNTAPSVTPLPTSQFVVYGGSSTPLSGIAVTDPDTGAATSASIVLTNGGTATDANGTLSGNNLMKSGVGAYSLAATTPANLSAELQALTFQTTGPGAAPGSSVATGLSVAVTEGDKTTGANTSVTFTTPDQEFDAAYYLKQNPDVAAAGVDPLTHYDTYGWMEGRNPDPYFNTNYYLNQNPDVAAAGINPLLHYEQSGWKEGRDPSVGFSTSKYLNANSDVVAANIDPLYHYLQYGAPEGRMAFMATPHGVGEQNPLVDNTYYFTQNPDVAAAGVNPFTHYDGSGWHEGRNPDAFFNTSYYLNQNSDVKAAGVDPLLHYEDSGWKEGRNPSAAFDTTEYLNHNSDVKAAGIDPLVHYLEYGMAEGRAIYPVPS